ncbi:hypothetical protein PPTG_13359 [Phytophthora nicotianae INRA-310]|uniref:PiggyBac transposable element-derived protein 4 C-terminal zinc-finger domain-containing protein n=1 Tax=Phytophthora nicotianae (strain INRA-310) TaxID=761204 RepID=W2Q5B4_PHYN3|nr:hypothetical protein PPTG_13359 [Phytophthora nicotianae INRA-310]ETN07460.1 hypothetical protein PPTG_13359 [Phytophthora nicotianae INRA-310]
MQNVAHHPPPAEECGGENITNSTSLSFRYKKREQFNSNPTLKQLRLSKAHNHLLVPIEGENVQLSCVMCCTLNHDSENAEHSRKGFKTRYMCSKCTVPLCRILRWNGEESCFTKFHKDKVLVNPCNVPEQLCTTRKNDNRAPP